METLRAVKGMNDILPEETSRWQDLEQRFRELALRYGYGEVRTPVVEPTALFIRSIGETTDIVEKEMYTFVDKGEQMLTLRPEGTASAARAYLEHRVHAREPVTKWFYIGPMFRRERPAKGRYRQFHQIGAEVFGDPGPFVDAEMVDMVVAFLRVIGVQDVSVLVNSLGGPGTRERYRSVLLAYLEPFRSSLCADCQRRMDTNPLRVLDCKVEADAERARQAPSLLDYLDPEDRAHFDGFCAALDALHTPYEVAPRLVRGLDYYTRTLFEVRGHSGNLGAQNTVCGGGRYDHLVESFGGASTPAIGFAMGIERLLLSASAATTRAALDVFVVAQPGMQLNAATLAQELRNDGLRVETDLRGLSFKSQLRRADKLGAPIALVVGEDESRRGVVQVKHLASQQQLEVERARVTRYVRESIEGNNR